MGWALSDTNAFAGYLDESTEGSTYYQDLLKKGEPEEILSAFLERFETFIDTNFDSADGNKRFMEIVNGIDREAMKKTATEEFTRSFNIKVKEQQQATVEAQNKLYTKTVNELMPLLSNPATALATFRKVADVQQDSIANLLTSMQIDGNDRRVWWERWNSALQELENDVKKGTNTGAKAIAESAFHIDPDAIMEKWRNNPSEFYGLYGDMYNMFEIDRWSKINDYITENSNKIGTKIKDKEGNDKTITAQDLYDEGLTKYNEGFWGTSSIRIQDFLRSWERYAPGPIKGAIKDMEGIIKDWGELTKKIETVHKEIGASGKAFESNKVLIWGESEKDYLKQEYKGHENALWELIQERALDLILTDNKYLDPDELEKVIFGSLIPAMFARELEILRDPNFQGNEHDLLIMGLDAAENSDAIWTDAYGGMRYIGGEYSGKIATEKHIARVKSAVARDIKIMGYNPDINNFVFEYDKDENDMDKNLTGTVIDLSNNKRYRVQLVRNQKGEAIDYKVIEVDKNGNRINIHSGGGSKF
jgi:hypothetical protein